jgi:hypothetical protein
MTSVTQVTSAAVIGHVKDIGGMDRACGADGASLSIGFVAWPSGIPMLSIGHC